MWNDCSRSKCIWHKDWDKAGIDVSFVHIQFIALDILPLQRLAIFTEGSKLPHVVSRIFGKWIDDIELEGVGHHRH